MTQTATIPTTMADAGGIEGTRRAAAVMVLDIIVFAHGVSSSGGGCGAGGSGGGGSRRAAGFHRRNPISIPSGNPGRFTGARLFRGNFPTEWTITPSSCFANRSG